MIGDPGLTLTTDPKIRDSVPGMAHFAHTGPAGSFCHECQHWDKKGRAVPKHKARPCAKYEALTRLIGSPVPGDTPACKYFAARSR